MIGKKEGLCAETDLNSKFKKMSRQMGAGTLYDEPKLCGAAKGRRSSLGLHLTATSNR